MKRWPIPVQSIHLNFDPSFTALATTVKSFIPNVFTNTSGIPTAHPRTKMQLRDTRGKSTAALLFYFLFLAPAAVSAHGFLQTITTPEQLYPCWSPHTDSYQKPEPKRYTRRYPNNGPIPDFTSDDIACNVGGNAPISEYISVKAGDKMCVKLPSHVLIQPNQSQTEPSNGTHGPNPTKAR